MTTNEQLNSHGTPELAKLWAAVSHVAQLSKQGLLTPTVRAGLRPLVDAASELALVTITESAEDTTAIYRAAYLALDRAKRVLPSIDDCLATPLSTKAETQVQATLVRYVREADRAFSQPPRVAHASPTEDSYEPYATTPAAALEEPDPSKLWLVRNLWQRSGTGIIGGGPKGGKTWLSLDLALSVASGTRVLDTFDVPCPGGVIYVCAEGGPAYVKQRLRDACVHRGLDLETLPHRLDIIPHSIRIDTAKGVGRLRATIEAFKPKLLVLDPLVRLHRIDENSASQVSAMLSDLTELQQLYDLAIILVHHTTKQGNRRSEVGGQDFRGSSDLHAWGDSNIFVRKSGPSKFVISAEHRAAPTTEKWTMQATTGECARLQIIANDAKDSDDQAGADDDDSMDREILHVMSQRPHSLAELRTKITGSNRRIGESLKRLQTQKKIVKIGRLWTVINGSDSGPRPRVA